MDKDLMLFHEFPDQKTAEVARVKLQKAGIIGMILSKEDGDSKMKKIALYIKPEDHHRAQQAVSAQSEPDLSSYMDETDNLIQKSSSSRGILGKIKGLFGK